MSRKLILGLIAAGATLTASTVDAQLVDLSQRSRNQNRLGITPGVLIAQPVGEFKNYVDAGFGFGAGVHYAIDDARIFSLRADLGFLMYGSETKRIPFPSIPRIRIDVNTTNNIFLYSVGPQLMAQKGPIRPYVHGFIGGAYFSTSSSIDGTSDFEDEDHFTTQHYGDGIFSYGGAGGLLIPLNVRRTPIAIDLGARYLRNGRTRYLREGSISDNPDGTLSFTPIESETNLWIYRLGVSIGVR
jgi:hypothetical protein